jgi:hypothetical protein
MSGSTGNGNGPVMDGSGWAGDGLIRHGRVLSGRQVPGIAGLLAGGSIRRGNGVKPGQKTEVLFFNALANKRRISRAPPLQFVTAGEAAIFPELAGTQSGPTPP